MAKAKKQPKPAEADPEMVALYNGLMLKIEPDLTTGYIDMLEFIYSDEPEDQRKARMERYKKAFDLFTERFSTLMEKWKEELEAIRQKALASLKQKDAQGMGDISQAIDNA